jgi:nucleoside-diphosphate-sugar epimerase
MQFFITGGSGFLGINLIRYLLAKGHTVVSYDIAPFEYPERDQLQAILGDIRDRAILKEAMKGSSVVVHAAAALPLYSPEDIRTTDIDGTRNVLDAARENGVERVVHISSTAVYGIPDHHPLLETDSLQGVGEYGKAKVAAEKLCEAAREQGMVVCILRPKSFVGPERLGVFALLYEWASEGHGFPMLGDGKNRYQLLDVDDLCDAIYLAATLLPEQVNDTYNIGAKEFTTMGEDYQAVLDRAGFKKKIVGLPAAPAIWTLRLLEALHLSPLYRWVYETASKDSFVSIEKAERELGYLPKYSNKDALLRNFEWYLSRKGSFKGAEGVSHRVPWKEGVLSIAKLFF